MAGFLIARTPEPVLLAGKYFDSLDRSGLQATRELKRIYRFFQAEQNVRLAIGHHEHGYHSEVQKALVSFFYRQADLHPPVRNLKILAEKTGRHTPGPDYCRRALPAKKRD